MRLFGCFCAMVIGALAAPPTPRNLIVYVGSYTKAASSKGITAYRFDASTGHITPIGVAAETPNPSFLAIHPNRRYLYAVAEVSNFEGKRSGAVAAFSIDAKTGKLSLLNRVASGGSGPCFVAVDRAGKDVLVANYNSGAVAVMPLKADGSLGEATSVVQHKGSGADPKRQAGPHAHSINLSPDNRFAIAADLGLDKLLVYRFDAAKGTIEPNEPPFTKVAPGSGPRHFTFHPDGKHAYVINEMALTVTAFNWDAAKGVLTEIETVGTLPKGVSSDTYSAAEVQMHPNGKFLYGSNRGHNSISVFAVSPDGKLKLIDNTPTQGQTPRNFSIDPSGKWLFAAHQDSGGVVVFKIDAKTGRLTPSGEKIDVPSPVCVKFLPVE